MTNFGGIGQQSAAVPPKANRGFKDLAATGGGQQQTTKASLGFRWRPAVVGGEPLAAAGRWLPPKLVICRRKHLLVYIGLYTTMYIYMYYLLLSADGFQWQDITR